MTKINDLNTKDELQGSDKFVIWDGETRAITAADAADYFSIAVGPYQPLDELLTSIAAAGPTSAAGQMFYTTAQDTVALANYSTIRGFIGAQPIDATLTAIAGLIVADGDLIRATGADTFETIATEELVGRQTLESFGAVGDGVVDDMAAFVLAAAAGVPLAGTQGKTYRTVGQFTAPAFFDLDLNGATWKPVYTGSATEAVNLRYPINSNFVSSGAVNTVTVQAGFNPVVTLSTTPSEIAVGDIIGFFATDLNGRWPIACRIVVDITGDDVTLDTIIPYTMSGTITCRKLNYNPLFSLVNGTIDCSAVADGTENVTGILRTMSYTLRRVQNITFTGVDLDTAFTNYIMYADYNYEVETIGVQAPNRQIGGSFLSSFRAHKSVTRDCQTSGQGFGIADVNTDFFSARHNTLAGDYSSNLSGASVRGIRPIGCLSGEIIHNEIVDFDSGIKLEDCANLLVDGNFMRGCNTGVNLSDQNPSSRSGGHRIVNNRIDSFLGYGITLGTNAAGDGLWRTCTLLGTIIGTGATGSSEPVIIRGGSFTASGNVIRGWSESTACFRTITNDGNLTTGVISDLYAITNAPSNRRGLDIAATHVGIAIDYDRVLCNASLGKFYALPPRKLAPAVTVCRQTVDMNSTADQALTLELPDGFTRYRLLNIIVTGNAAASLAVGGVYTDASKGGTAVVANTQVYTSITGANTNQNLTISTAGAQVMTDLSLFFSLTTAHGTAATAELMIIAYPVT
jgi:hypothetical protein